MKTTNIADAQHQFVLHSEDYWTKINQSNAKAANGVVRAMDRLAKNWLKQEILEDVLSPLLAHTSAQVQLSAAAYLVSHASYTPAIAVLERLAADPATGLVAISAAAVLRVNKIG